MGFQQMLHTIQLRKFKCYNEMKFCRIHPIRVNMTNFHRLTLGSTSVIPLSVLPKLVLIFGL